VFCSLEVRNLIRVLIIRGPSVITSRIMSVGVVVGWSITGEVFIIKQSWSKVWSS
jgi:hypothetical protein